MQYLYNNAMVVTLNIANYNVYSMLIDNEILVDILFYDTLFKMYIPSEWLDRMDAPVTGFSRELVPSEGTIVLLVMAGSGPR